MTIEPVSIPYKLRQRADTYWTHRASDQADLDRASADEIEKLREECVALRDEAELKQAALTGTSRVMGEEIARLRGLLRDFLAEHDSVEVHKRVREALGE